jgi:glycosyltransferase involved in cell wall biosynthesis
MKLLLIAPWACHNDVGEAWSTYQWIEGLSARYETTVLTTRKRCRDSIRDRLPRDVEIVEWTDPGFFARHERFNSIVKPDYLAFSRRARAWIRAAQSRGRRFDLVHQLSPLALRYSSPAAQMNVPLVVGPLAGGLETPAPFRDELGSEPVYARFRGIDRLRLRWDPRLRATIESAAVVIGVAPYVLNLLHHCRVRVPRFEIMSETGVCEIAPPRGPLAPERAHEFRLVYVGRLIRTKGLRDAIRALGRLRQTGAAARRHVSLTVIGDGPDRALCEAEAQQLGVGDLVTFRGRLPRTEIDRFYQEADAMIFPSFREPSGNVVLEALSFGLPVITTTCGGPGYAIDETCGIRVDPVSPDAFSEGLAAAVSRLAGDPALVRRLSAGARKRAQDHFLWSSKIDRMSALYATVVNRVHEAPTTGVLQRV